MENRVKRRTTLKKVALGSELRCEVQVVREFWYNEESCKGVYLVEMESGERVTIKGDFHRPLVPNLDYDVQGVLGEFRGSQQIEVIHYRTLSPKNRSAMIALLKTIPGISKKAQDIFQLYRYECLEILKTDPDRVIKEAGLQRRWAIRAQNYLLTEMEGEEYITELLTYGITIKEAKILYKTYKEDVLTTIRNNPYLLREEVNGFSFNKCEKIANEVGFNLYSSHRIEAAILQELNDATYEGHCFLLGDHLVARSIDLLQRMDAPIQPLHIYPAIKSLYVQNKIVIEKERVYLKTFHNMEKEVCQRLISLIKASTERPVAEVEEALATVLARHPEIVLEDKQREAIIEANRKRGGVFILNGHAGTGKTFTLSIIMEVFAELKKKEAKQMTLEKLLATCETEEEIQNTIQDILKESPLVVEALHTLGKTDEAHYLEGLIETIEDEETLIQALNQLLHVAQRSDVQQQLPEHHAWRAFEEAESVEPRSGKDKSKILPKKLYLAPTGKAAKVISRATNQEACTIHKGLNYDPITKEFKQNEENPLKQEVIVCDETSMLDLWLFYKLLKAIKPGTKLILLGDTHQLPSIGAGNVLKDLLASQVIDFVTLTIVKRQGLLSDILKNAKNILEGKVIKNYNQTNDAFFIKENNPATIQDILLDEMEKLLQNPEFTMDEIQLLSPMRKGPLGTNMLNYLVQQRFNPAPDPESEVAVIFESPIGYGESEKITLEFKRGDRVINIKNNYELKFCIKTKEGDYEEDESLGVGITNGECGTLVDVIYEEDEDTDKLVKHFVVQYEEGYAKYAVTDLDNLLHAYCLTVHKSQGSGWKAVLFPIHSSHYRMLENNLIYTAWTRSRIYAMAVGNEDLLSRAVQTFKANTRNTTLAPRLKYLSSLLKKSA